MLSTSRTSHKKSTSGFTLLEILIITVIVSILGIIAASSWVGLTRRMALNAANDEIYIALREAQTKAKQQKITFQASFREQDNRTQWAVHPAATLPANAIWQNLDPNIEINAAETTVYRYPSGTWRMQFNHKGHANGRLGRITVSVRNYNISEKRCVFISTLLGTIRKAQQNLSPDSGGRYCY